VFEVTLSASIKCLESRTERRRIQDWEIRVNPADICLKQEFSICLSWKFLSKSQYINNSILRYQVRDLDLNMATHLSEKQLQVFIVFVE
jgi:hypothetical protein